MTDEATAKPIEDEPTAEKFESENESNESAVKKSFSHTVGHKDGGTITIENYSMRKAILLWCSECEGFESDPRECTDKLCPFFPYKGLTLKNRRRLDLEKLKENYQKNADKIKANLEKARLKRNQQNDIQKTDKEYN